MYSCFIYKWTKVYELPQKSMTLEWTLRFGGGKSIGRRTSTYSILPTSHNKKRRTFYLSYNNPIKFILSASYRIAFVRGLFDEPWCKFWRITLLVYVSRVIFSFCELYEKHASSFSQINLLFCVWRSFELIKTSDLRIMDEREFSGD